MAVDWWSFGALGFDLLSGAPPLPRSKPRQDARENRQVQDRDALFLQHRCERPPHPSSAQGSIKASWRKHGERPGVDQETSFSSVRLTGRSLRVGNSNLPSNHSSPILNSPRTSRPISLIWRFPLCYRVRDHLGVQRTLLVVRILLVGSVMWRVQSLLESDGFPGMMNEGTPTVAV